METGLCRGVFRIAAVCRGGVLKQLAAVARPVLPPSAPAPVEPWQGGSPHTALAGTYHGFVPDSPVDGLARRAMQTGVKTQG